MASHHIKLKEDTKEWQEKSEQPQMFSGTRKRKISSSLLSPPSQAWETIPELTGTAAENSEMLLQGRKVEVLPPAMSQDYEGSWRDGATLKNTDCSWRGPHLGFPAPTLGGLQPKWLQLQKAQRPLLASSNAHTHVLTPMHRHTHTHK